MTRENQQTASSEERIALVTGAHGFLGRHYATYLHSLGYQVHGIGHGHWQQGEAKHWGLASWTPSDLTLDALQKLASLNPMIIAHCAGGSSVGLAESDPASDYQRTVVATEQVLEGARLKWPGARIIFPSSGAVYGDVKKQPIVEGEITKPVSIYGKHKLASEKQCQIYATKHGLYITIIRLFSVYGEGLQKQLLWDACSKISKGMYEFYGTGSESRDWLHISDAISLMHVSTQFASQECPVVNAGTGEYITNSEILEILCKKFGATGHPRFNGMSRKGDPQQFTADTTLARSWKWAPLVEVEDGIERYVRWFKSEGS